MKNTKLLFSITLFLSCIFLAVNGWAQATNSTKPSPPATAEGKIGTVKVTVNYSSPAVKGRQIWGGLVPYGKVWRAGANEATTVAFDKDVMVEGKALPAGTYSLFTIPGEKEWTVILNKQTGQWGTRYDDKQDALRVTVKPQKNATSQERLTYEVKNNALVLLWENLKVPIIIKAQK